MKITKELAKELLPIVTALAKGKKIQEKIEGVTDWVDTDEINLECDGKKILHRVKPKPEPKYRPFKTREECWEEMHKHPDFGWIKVNVTSEYEQVVRVFDYCKTELCFNIANSDDDYTSEMMLNSYTFTDGTPFGIKE